MTNNVSLYCFKYTANTVYSKYGKIRGKYVQLKGSMIVQHSWLALATSITTTHATSLGHSSSMHHTSIGSIG
jgi:hypothetical protein